jgi:anaerobic selenocysteine-containing dehydrogenase
VKIDGSVEVENREAVPYKEGFDTDDSEFVFLEEFEVPQKVEEGEFYLITPKAPTSLNSQFHRDSYLYLNSSLGFTQGSRVRVLSNAGEAEFIVKINDDLREDCVLIHSGAEGVNNLTSSQHSYEGKSAIFQENFVRIIKLD